MDTTFDTIDINQYTRISNVSLPTLIALRRSLDHVAPDPVERTPQVDRAIVELDAATDEAKEALLERRRQDHSPEYGAPRPFDGAVDGLWRCVVTRVGALQAFEHPGLDPLIAAGGVRGQRLARNRRRAERGQDLLELLLGPGRLAFTKLQFNDQAAVMDTILQLVDENEVADEIDNLAGLEILVSLRDCQALYEDMVSDRLAGDKVDPEALTTIRRRLIRAIVSYNVAVFGLLDRSRPETLDIVVRALRPVLILRQRIAEGRSYVGAAFEDEDDELGEDERFDEGEAQAEADELDAGELDAGEMLDAGE